MRQNLQNEAPLELAYCFLILNAARMHLRHKTVQLTFHKILFLFPTRSTVGSAFVSPNSVSTTEAASSAVRPTPDGFLRPRRTAQRVSPHGPLSEIPELTAIRSASLDGVKT